MQVKSHNTRLKSISLVSMKSVDSWAGLMILENFEWTTTTTTRVNHKVVTLFAVGIGKLVFGFNNDQ